MAKLLLTAATVLAALPVAAARVAAFAGDATPVAAQPTVVEIRNMHYVPASLTITAGTKVTWVNDDEMPHTVTDRNRVFRSAALDTKDRFSYTFAAPGTFTYFCTIHPFMVGKIIVTPSGKAS